MSSTASKKISGDSKHGASGAESPEFQGTVEWYDEKRGFGRLIVPGGRMSVEVSFEDIVTHPPTLNSGDNVKFGVRVEDRENVKVGVAVNVQSFHSHHPDHYGLKPRPKYCTGWCKYFKSQNGGYFGFVTCENYDTVGSHPKLTQDVFIHQNDLKTKTHPQSNDYVRYKLGWFNNRWTAKELEIVECTGKLLKTQERRKMREQQKFVHSRENGSGTPREFGSRQGRKSKDAPRNGSGPNKTRNGSGSNKTFRRKGQGSTPRTDGSSSSLISPASTSSRPNSTGGSHQKRQQNGFNGVKSPKAVKRGGKRPNSTRNNKKQQRHFQPKVTPSSTQTSTGAVPPVTPQTNGAKPPKSAGAGAMINGSALPPKPQKMQKLKTNPAVVHREPVVHREVTPPTDQYPKYDEEQSPPRQRPQRTEKPTNNLAIAVPQVPVGGSVAPIKTAGTKPLVQNPKPVTTPHVLEPPTAAQIEDSERLHVSNNNQAIQHEAPRTPPKVLQDVEMPASPASHPSAIGDGVGPHQQRTHAEPPVQQQHDQGLQQHGQRLQREPQREPQVPDAHDTGFQAHSQPSVDHQPPTEAPQTHQHNTFGSDRGTTLTGGPAFMHPHHPQPQQHAQRQYSDDVRGAPPRNTFMYNMPPYIPSQHRHIQHQKHHQPQPQHSDFLTHQSQPQLANHQPPHPQPQPLAEHQPPPQQQQLAAHSTPQNLEQKLSLEVPQPPPSHQAPEQQNHVLPPPEPQIVNHQPLENHQPKEEEEEEEDVVQEEEEQVVVESGEIEQPREEVDEPAETEKEGEVSSSGLNTTDMIELMQLRAQRLKSQSAKMFDLVSDFDSKSKEEIEWNLQSIEDLFENIKKTSVDFARYQGELRKMLPGGKGV